MKNCLYITDLEVGLEPAYGKLKLVELHEIEGEGQSTFLVVIAQNSKVKVPLVTYYSEKLRDLYDAEFAVLTGMYELGNNGLLTLRTEKKRDYSRRERQLFIRGGLITLDGIEEILENTSIAFYESSEDRIYSEYGQIYHREVDQNLRMHGIGTKLFDLAEEHLASIGNKDVSLETYKKEDFDEFLIKRGYIRTDKTGSDGEQYHEYRRNISHLSSNPSIQFSDLNKYVRIEVLNKGRPALIIGELGLYDNHV